MAVAPLSLLLLFSPCLSYVPLHRSPSALRSPISSRSRGRPVQSVAEGAVELGVDEDGTVAEALDAVLQYVVQTRGSQQRPPRAPLLCSEGRTVGEPADTREPTTNLTREPH